MPLLDHVGVKVTDLDRSIKFYSDLFGFEMVDRRMLGRSNVEAAAMQVGGSIIFVLYEPSFRARSADEHGVVDLGERRIRAIEFLPTADLEAAPDRLYGTVRTPHGSFTGFVQWDRQSSVGSDELQGRTADGQLSLRFDAIRTIARDSEDSALVTLHDGGEFVLAATI